MNSKFYRIGIGVSILLIGILITFFVLANKSNKKTAEAENNFPSVMSSTNITDESLVSETNTFNEIAEANKIDENNVTSENNKTENKNSTNSVNTEKTNTTQNNTIKTDDTESNNEEVEKEENTDPVFLYPVEGELIVDYAKDKLVYSNTLGEWITHLGVDIKADKTTVVKSASDGTVKSIKNDPRYGLTVVIEHNNGFSTVYSNLLTAEFVNVGEKVTSGQTIGTVGNTASFEILDESHLHFEILKDNEQIDPNMYLKN